MNLPETRRRIDRLESEWNHATLTANAERTALTQAETNLADFQAGQTLLQEVAQAVQNVAHRRIAAVVTRCLQAVFGEEAYEFRIEFEKKRSKTEAVLSFWRDGESFDPLESTGGGVVDVAAFALRLACVVLSQPRRRRLLVLDEPLKMLSANHLPAVAELLEALAEEMGFQVVLVTHSPDLQVGKVIEL